MLSVVIFSKHSYPAVPLVRQLVLPEACPTRSSRTRVRVFQIAYGYSR